MSVSPHEFDVTILLFGRVSLALGLAFVAMAACRGRRAATRSSVWNGVVLCLLVLPVLAAVLPAEALTLPSPAPFLAAVTALSASSDSRVWFFVWSSGVAVLVTRLLLAVAAARRLAERSRDVSAEDDVARLFARICAAANLRRRVRIATSDEITVPMTMGVLRPRVLLPVDAGDWSADRLEAVLRHEVAHIARYDYVARLAFELVCALYWPNPLVWYAARRARTEQERAADDYVLERGTSPNVYADVLIAIARASIARPLESRGTLAATAPPLKARIVAILDGRDRHTRRATRRAVATAVVCATAATAPAIAVLSVAPPAQPLRVAVAPDSGVRQPRQLFVAAGDSLLHTLYYSDRPAERLVAARRLVRTGTARTTPTLVALLSDSCYSYRWRAARGLRELADAAALDPLIEKMLADRHPAVRSMAANAIAALPLSKSAPALRAALTGAKPSTFDRAGRALDTLGETPVHQVLLAALRDARARRVTAFRSTPTAG